MADQPSLHIDDDWKKQAQEEKRKLVEQEQKRTVSAPAAAPVVGPVGASASAGKDKSARSRRDVPEANFATIVQSVWTQAMMYLGELAPQGSEPMLNLDMARQQFDLLAVLETKTKGNLTDDEVRLLDAALYETSSRFINVASQYI